jgi:hypothetical protein
MLRSGHGDIGTIDAQQSLFDSIGQAGGHSDVQAVGHRWVPESAAADAADPAAVESLWIVLVANRIGSNLHVDAPAPVVRLLAEKGRAAASHGRSLHGPGRENRRSGYR